MLPWCISYSCTTCDKFTNGDSFINCDNFNCNNFIICNNFINSDNFINYDFFINCDVTTIFTTTFCDDDDMDALLRCCLCSIYLYVNFDNVTTTFVNTTIFDVIFISTNSAGRRVNDITIILVLNTENS